MQHGGIRTIMKLDAIGPIWPMQSIEGKQSVAPAIRP
jgi:hypothetical protein